jgi:hypothetical protein
MIDPARLERFEERTREGYTGLEKAKAIQEALKPLGYEVVEYKNDVLTEIKLHHFG